MPDTIHYTLADDRLTFTLEQHANHFTASLLDRATGHTWGPTPLLVLDLHDKTLRRSEPTERYRIDLVERLDETTLHLVFGVTAAFTDVGLWIRLRDGELSVLLSPPEVYERRPAHFRLFAIDLLPDLMHAGPDGRLLMPLGSGCFCEPRGKSRVRDRMLIYLEQDRWELATTLPYAAVETPTASLLAIATQGACDALCTVETDGKDHGRQSLGFSLRRHWPDPVDMDNREIRYVPLAPSRAGLVPDVAARLQRHVMEDLGKSTIKTRIAECPDLAYLQSAYTMKLFYARENEGYEARHNTKNSHLTFLLGMTFKEAAEGLRRIHAAGIPRVLTQSVGWNARGHDGLYPQRFPIDERLGGEAGFRDLIAYGNGLGFHMNVHDNFGMNVATANNFDTDMLIHDMYGEPLLSGWWGGGLEYQSWGHALSEERLQGHMRRVKDLGIRGLFYADYMMRPLECNYHPKWRGSRADHARAQCRVFDAAREVYGSIGTEYGILPACVAVDYITAGGSGRTCRPEWPIKELMGESVPMWDLVLHGLVLHERTGIAWSNVQETLLFGKHPRDEWTIRTHVGHAELTDTRIAQQKAIYDLCIARFGHLQSERLVDYQTPADGVRQTRFEDGTEVIANSKTGELRINGEHVARPSVLPA